MPRSYILYVAMEKIFKDGIRAYLDTLLLSDFNKAMNVDDGRVVLVEAFKLK